MSQLCHLHVLKKRSEFLAVSACRKRWVTPAFIIQKAPRTATNDGEACGFGLTASKKMIGCAVKRNRARRRLRALVREVLPVMSVAGLDFVFIAKDKVLTHNYEALRKDLKWALKRLNVLPS